MNLATLIEAMYRARKLQSDYMTTDSVSYERCIRASRQEDSFLRAIARGCEDAKLGRMVRRMPERVELGHRDPRDFTGRTFKQPWFTRQFSLGVRGQLNTRYAFGETPEEAMRTVKGMK